MMAHSVSPEKLAEQARIMVDAGCQCVYVVDSAGAMIMDEVTERVAAVVAEVGDDGQVGFHGHDNLGIGVANSRARRSRRRGADRRLDPRASAPAPATRRTRCSLPCANDSASRRGSTCSL